MNSTTFIGCDPGAKGAFCVLTIEMQGPPTIEFFDNNSGFLTINSNLEKIEKTKNVRMAIREDVHSLFGMSAKSNFSFGAMVREAQNLLTLRSFGHDLVKPKEWQKVIGLTIPAKLKGKERSKFIKMEIANICNRIYPGCDIYGPKGGLMDGRSDALMIAHYCYLKYK